MKRFGSTMYCRTRRGKKSRFNEDGYLYAQGRYPTKIKAEDLPEWYIGGLLQGEYVYVSAKGIKHMVFVPDYSTFRGKGSFLYISYDRPIVPDTSSPSGKWLNGYNHILCGEFVEEYLKGVAKYSCYDIKPIMQQVLKSKR